MQTFFSDVDDLGINTLTIKGPYIRFIDNLNNPLIDLDNTHISITPQLRCFSKLIVDGSASFTNIYTKTQADNLISSQSNSYTKLETDNLLNWKVKNTDFNTLSSTVNLNSLNISELNLNLSSGLVARYTKT